MIKPHEPIKRSVITQQGQVVIQARGHCPSSQRTGTARKSLPGNQGQSSAAWFKGFLGKLRSVVLNQAPRDIPCTKQTPGWFTVTDGCCAFIHSWVSASLQHGDITAVVKRVWFNFFDLSKGKRSLVFVVLVARVGGNESHPCFCSVCIPSQVCVNLNLSHPTCTGLYLLWILGGFSMYVCLVEELAEHINWLSVPCVLTTRGHHTLSVFCQRF